MTQTLAEWCENRADDSLIRQWDRKKNGALTPKSISRTSREKVWWRCSKGHEWSTSVKSRTEGSGCPICTNRVILPGYNDLATAEPALAAEWDPEKNGGLTPRDVSAGSSKRVWWRCAKGHSWRTTIASRSAPGHGCPYCSGLRVSAGENDLASNYPQLAAEWDTEKNGDLTASDVTSQSNRKVWWRCPLGHSYATVVKTRVEKNSGCPYCTGQRVLPGFNDLATKDPAVAAQWHPTLNGTLTPDMVTCGSRRKVWWQCPLGHSWKAVVSSRTGKRRHGCPVCAGHVKSRNTDA